jgi:hypothetical protein
MIQKLSHATIYVLDHEQALDFYTNKLGFEVRLQSMCSIMNKRLISTPTSWASRCAWT